MAGNQYITPDKIRLFMLDRSAEDNFLLDAVEMSSESIDLAMEMAVDSYNYVTPILTPYATIEGFPHRSLFMLGVVAWLLRSKALNLTRNALSYQSASGTAVDDKQVKAKAYMDLSDKLMAEFKDVAAKLKQEQNVAAGFAHLPGPPRGYRF